MEEMETLNLRKMIMVGKGGGKMTSDRVDSEDLRLIWDMQESLTEPKWTGEVESFCDHNWKPPPPSLCLSQCTCSECTSALP